MSAASHIEWTEATWNPVTGCSKVSEGCLNCYAERMTRRLQAMGNMNYAAGFDTVVCHEHMLEAPQRWRRPRTVFVNSMGDLFHPDVPEAFVRRVFAVMAETPRHTYQVLTKRAERMAQMELAWPANVWAGVTIESGRYLDRLAALGRVRARMRFLSLEPLLGSLEGIDLAGVDWVIAGGESGPGARSMDPEWVRDIREACGATGTPFFFKQWGGVRKAEAGRVLDGRTWSGMPGVIGVAAS